MAFTQVSLGMEKHEQYTWAGPMLRAAGAYNMIWGSWVVLFPLSFFEWFGLTLPNYPMIWQSVGMIVGVYGLGYWISSYNPQRHWPIVLVGFLGKVFGPVGAVYYMFLGQFPFQFGLINITNDLIWIIPFGLVLYQVWRNEMLVGHELPNRSVGEILKETVLNGEESLYDLSMKSPVMLVFLRHSGCTFCKETLRQLEKSKEQREQFAQLILIHMSSKEESETFLRKYDLGKYQHLPDPEQSIYRAFSLGRGNFSQLFGLQEWLKGSLAAFRGIFPGVPVGDGFRMPGSFLIYKGQVISQWRASRASEKLPLKEILSCELSD